MLAFQALCYTLYMGAFIANDLKIYFANDKMFKGEVCIYNMKVDILFLANMAIIG